MKEDEAMNPIYDFKGQVALVTGASSGIGLATARAFADAGAAVVLADVNQDALRTATDELTSAGHQAIGVSCDVADEAQAATMVERTVATFGRLDMAFNNAGILGFTGEFAEESAESFDQMTAINLRGQQFLARRSYRWAEPCFLPRVQAWRDRPDEERGNGVCAGGDSHQCRVPGRSRHSHERRHGQEPP
jgi:NAD(P)-dependent dehydrogenase (short-subunit alcohol dehydrogenase family)